MRKQPLAVLAVGGNALSPPEGIHPIEVEEEKAAAFAKVVASFRKNGYRTLIVHGNGPQVGNLLLQNELARSVVPSLPLAMCNAQTQGSIGYMLHKALLHEFTEKGISGEITGMITTVEVRVEPGLKPEKPIGRFYSTEELAVVDPLGEKSFVECDNGLWRRMVLSPQPRRILEADSIRLLLEQGVAVIAGGGGGIAYTRTKNGYEPVEAIVDKDLTAALLARQLNADFLFLMTNVDEVMLHFGTPQENRLRSVSVQEMRGYLEDGCFPSGSMGPKVRAAVEFVEATGQCAVITRPELAEQALLQQRGTMIGPVSEKDRAYLKAAGENGAYSI